MKSAWRWEKSVILMHDAGDKDVTVEFLPQLIEKYLAEGYEFCNYYEIMM